MGAKEDLILDLKRFIENIETHDIYTVLEVGYLIKLAVLEAFRNGRISQEVADRILFAAEEGINYGKTHHKTSY